MMKKDLILEVALVINKELYEENKITFKMFSQTEKEILTKLGRG